MSTVCLPEDIACDDDIFQAFTVPIHILAKTWEWNLKVLLQTFSLIYTLLKRTHFKSDELLPGFPFWRYIQVVACLQLEEKNNSDKEQFNMQTGSKIL